MVGSIAYARSAEAYVAYQVVGSGPRDLLVVMDFEGSARDQRVEIRLALHDILVPKDVIVTRPKDFAWRKDQVGTIEWPAAREGKVLYARH